MKRRKLSLLLIIIIITTIKLIMKAHRNYKVLLHSSNKMVRKRRKIYHPHNLKMEYRNSSNSKNNYRYRLTKDVLCRVSRLQLTHNYSKKVLISSSNSSQHSKSSNRIIKSLLIIKRVIIIIIERL